MKKTIPVYFAQYEPEDDCLVWKKHIGDVPVDQANKFLQSFTDEPRQSNACIDYIHAEYSNNVITWHGGTRPQKRNKFDILAGEIKLSEFFSCDYAESDFCNYKTLDDEYLSPGPMCAKRSRRSERSKMNICAKSICNGKCVDPLMRKLAAMMYPEKYNNKQR